MMATPLCPARTPQGPGRAGFCFPKLGWFDGTVLHLLLQNSIFFFADFSFLCPQEDHGGEVDDNDDLELVKERAGTRGGRKDDYF